MSAPRGFSLLELFLVLFIIGVLTSLSTPRFMGMGARAKRAEATEALATIARLQAASLAEKTRYEPDLKALHFELEGAKWNADGSLSTRRYTFSCTQPSGALTYLCTATGNLDTDPFYDVVATGAGPTTPQSTAILYDDADDRVNDPGPLATLVAP
jgi:prepilin-type N-terminal cleavage/methylation domain-containing protein